MQGVNSKNKRLWYAENMKMLCAKVGQRVGVGAR